MENFMQVINDKKLIYRRLYKLKGKVAAYEYAQRNGLPYGKTYFETLEKAEIDKYQSVEVLKYTIKQVFDDRLFAVNLATNKCIVLFKKNYPDLFCSGVEGKELSVSIHKEKIISITW
jgi:hypothetical protein